VKQRHNLDVMPALVAGIHVFLRLSKTWMAGTSGAKTGIAPFARPRRVRVCVSFTRPAMAGAKPFEN
jgi:hypothetical protein